MEREVNPPLRGSCDESRGQYQEEKIAGSNPPTLSGGLQEQTLVQGSWWPSGRLQVADS